MNILHYLFRVAQIPWHIACKAEVHLSAIYMQIVNRYGRSAITHPGGPVVSLTSHGSRVKRAHLAIESIGRGKMLPSRIILWIEDESLIDNLPAGLRRLQKRGLEVLLCKDYGPHKKYYPYLQSLAVVETPLVTADDDLLYPSYWLKRLVEAYRQYPGVVNCYRARVIVLNQEGLAKYQSWKLSRSTMPSYHNFAGSGAGSIYPIPLQNALKNGSAGFMNCCPRADDIWIHAQALRAGYKVRQIHKNEFRLRVIPGTQRVALHRHNQAHGENDPQIAATYRSSDIERLRNDE
jgi:hypothetical protein